MCTTLFMSCSSVGWILALISFSIFLFLILVLLFGESRKPAYASEASEETLNLERATNEVRVIPKEPDLDGGKDGERGVKNERDAKALIAKVSGSSTSTIPTLSEALEDTPAEEARADPFRRDKVFGKLEKALGDEMKTRNEGFSLSGKFSVRQAPQKMGVGGDAWILRIENDRLGPKRIELDIQVTEEKIRIPAPNIRELEKVFSLKDWKTVSREIKDLIDYLTSV